MVSKRVNYFCIGLAVCMNLILLGLAMWFIVSSFRVVCLPVGEERYYTRTDVSDGAIEGARPVLYVNVVSTGERLESSLSFLDLMVTDTEIKAKQPGIRMMQLSYYGNEDETSYSKYYIFIVYEP